MGSLTFSELATIAVIVLIVFGPRRLPELARRAGTLAARVRDASRAIREELSTEYADTIEPLQEVRRDLEAARDDLKATARDVGESLEQVQSDVTGAADEVKADVESALEGGEEAPAVGSGPLEGMREQVRRAREGIEGDDPGDATKKGDT